ncbi:MAG TPA: SDR family NAD(P)-dependent oxidoreductase [Solirubrobacteraceae bacterium]
MTDRAAQVLGDIFGVRDLRVVVTGAASGLGFAMAEVLADCGARVTLADVDAELLEQSTGALADRGGSVRAAVCDVSDADRVQALFDEVVAADGGVDVVFANAGIGSTPGWAIEGGQQLDTIHRSDWDKVLGVNLNGILFTMKSAAAAMKRQGAGRIVVTSSVAGLRPEPVVCYGYIASKAAVLNIVRQAALELARHGIRVNAICPGPFKGTRIGGGGTLDPDPDTEQQWADTVPLGRMAEPEELKGLVLLLASPAGGFITGAAHVIDGGALIHAPGA